MRLRSACICHVSFSQLHICKCTHTLYTQTSTYVHSCPHKHTYLYIRTHTHHSAFIANKHTQIVIIHTYNRVIKYSCPHTHPTHTNMHTHTRLHTHNTHTLQATGYTDSGVSTVFCDHLQTPSSHMALRF